LPRYGLGNYQKTTPHKPPTTDEARVLADLSRAGTRLKGFCRTNLFKRLESSGHAFILSLERHILRNFIFLHAIEHDLPLPGDPPLPGKYGLEGGNTAETYYKLLPAPPRSEGKTPTRESPQSAQDCGSGAHGERRDRRRIHLGSAPHLRETTPGRPDRVRSAVEQRRRRSAASRGSNDRA
jgi:hypothetical protein